MTAPTNLTDAMVQDHLSLVYQIAKSALRKFSPSTSIDDLVSLGYSGLMKAAASFDPLLGHPFQNYAYRVVSRSMLSGTRRLPVKTIPATNRLRDTVPNPEEQAIATERRSVLIDAIAMLPSCQRSVLIAHYIEQRPLADIAKELGCSPGRVSQIHRASLKSMRLIIGNLKGSL